MNKLTPLASVLATSLLLATATPAAAVESAKLESHESKGWMNAIGRIGGYYTFLTGEIPVRDPVVPDTVNVASFKRSGPGIDFDLMGFWDATRFDTLLGAEMKIQFGLLSGPGITRDGRDDKDSGSRFTVRWDNAFDYGFIHVKSGAIKARLSGGAGFGMDYDGGRLNTGAGRAYPLLLARAHLFISDDLGGHLAYHWVPTSTNDTDVHEHRFEAAGSISQLQLGARYVMTKALRDGVTQYSAKELSIFVAYAF